jgi:hypothetical protein
VIFLGYLFQGKSKTPGSVLQNQISKFDETLKDSRNFSREEMTNDGGEMTMTCKQKKQGKIKEKWTKTISENWPENHQEIFSTKGIDKKKW